MNATEMVAAVRLSGRFSDSDEDYAASVVRQQITATLQQVFGDKVVGARAGAWTRKKSTTVTASRTRYRVPHRAQALKLLRISSDARIPYTIFGDVVEYDSAPNTSDTVDFTYYLRPSLLCELQAGGLITAVDTSARTVNFASLPTNKVTTAALANGDTVDIVHPNGWHELSLVGAVATLTGAGPYTITFPAGTDLTDVEVGDYVRSAEQTDWPCLPDEYHQCLADMTAARMHRSKGNESKAKALEAQAGGDLERFASMIEPRFQDEQEVCVPDFGPIRGRRPFDLSGRFSGF